MPSDSHFNSNIVAKNGTESISGFTSISGTSLVGALTGNVRASNFLKIGSGTGCKYIFAGAETVQASIVIAGQALADVTASLEGSLYIAKDNIWQFTSTTLATPITVP